MTFEVITNSNHHVRPGARLDHDTLDLTNSPSQSNMDCVALKNALSLIS